MKIRTIQILYLLLTAFVMGSGLFMSFVVAPVVFSRFPKEMAGDITASLFPSYFMIQIISSLLILLLLGGVLRRGILRQKMTLSFCFLLLLSALTNDFYILPKVREYRHNPSQKEEFRREHGKSMVLNLLALISSLGLVCLTPNVLSCLQSGKSPALRIKDE